MAQLEDETPRVQTDTSVDVQRSPSKLKSLGLLAGGMVLGMGATMFEDTRLGTDYSAQEIGRSDYSDFNLQDGITEFRKGDKLRTYGQITSFSKVSASTILTLEDGRALENPSSTCLVVQLQVGEPSVQSQIDFIYTGATERIGYQGEFVGTDVIIEGSVLGGSVDVVGLDRIKFCE